MNDSKLPANTPNAVRRGSPVNGSPVFRIVFASTSGHTEYVVDVLVQYLEQHAQNWQIDAAMAEKTRPDDLLTGSIVVLASATWNTGGSEGQLNPHMQALLQEKATHLDLGGKPYACIGLGDDRYYYTARAVDLLQAYVTGHHGRLILPSLEIVNEPYGQEEKVRAWARQLLEAALQNGWS